MIARGPGPEIVYPERDGKPMADNTLQFEWIVTIEGNLDRMFHDRPDVFVAGDNLWYPVDGEPTICQAPDVYVVFGRPKGHRGCYKQWLENDIPLTVVFEILSPGNTRQEMDEKLRFYHEYGVQEYYIYDPNKEKLSVYERGRATLRRIRFDKEYISPRLGIRFDLSDEKLVIYTPENERFYTFVEIGLEFLAAKRRAEEESLRAEAAELRATVEKERAEKEKERAEVAERLALDEKERAEAAERLARDEKERAEKEKERAEKEKERAEKEKERAESAERLAREEKERAKKEKERAVKEKERAEQAERQAALLAERLRQLGFDPEA